jgi:hypothetical protein
MAPNDLDWSAIVVPPGGTDGFFEAQSLVLKPSLSGFFTVDFTFLGLGTPGPQDFETFSPDSNEFLISTGITGRTTPASFDAVTVPEPNTGMLFGSGLLALFGFQFFRRRRAV